MLQGSERRKNVVDFPQEGKFRSEEQNKQAIDGLKIADFAHIREISLHTSPAAHQGGHQAGPYPGFCCMKLLSNNIPPMMGC